MARFLLHHRHDARECGPAFASFRGHESPLRRRPALGSCRYGGHDLWWVVTAGSRDEALALLPSYVALRTTATAIAEVVIP
jgi:hypothetical protein